MNIINITVYPEIGNSYIIHLNIDKEKVNDIENFVEEWINENLINVTFYELTVP